MSTARNLFFSLALLPFFSVPHSTENVTMVETHWDKGQYYADFYTDTGHVYELGPMEDEWVCSEYYLAIDVLGYDIQTVPRSNDYPWQQLK